MDNENYFDNWEFGDDIVKAAMAPFRRMLSKCFEDFADGMWFFEEEDGAFVWNVMGDGMFAGESPIRLAIDPQDIRKALLKAVAFSRNGEGKIAAEDAHPLRSVIAKLRDALNTAEKELDSGEFD